MAAAGRCVAYSPERRGRMAELEAEFAARQREMERMQINDGATGAGDAGEQGAQEAAVPKQLSGTELLMQRLAAMGALDENSAPPDGISAAGAPAANGPREASAKATGDGANGKIPAPSPTGKKASPALSPEAKRARMEARMKKRADARKRAALARKNKLSASPKATTANPSSEQAGNPSSAPETAQPEGPSSTDLLRQRLAAAMGDGPAAAAAVTNKPPVEAASAGSSPSSTDLLKQRLKRMMASGASESGQPASRSQPQSPSSAKPTSPVVKAAAALRSQLGQNVPASSPKPTPQSSSAPGGPVVGQSKPDTKIAHGRSLSAPDLRAMMEAEHELLNQEVVETQAELKRERANAKQLQDLLDNAMAEYERAVQDVNLRRADDVARLGLQETELKQLRERVKSSDVKVQTLEKANSELEANNSLLAESEKELSRQLDAAKKELSKSQTLFDKLKKHAEDKLQNAAKLYSEMQKLAEQKISESERVGSELAQSKNKCRLLEEKLSTAQQNVLLMEERSAGLTKQVSELQQSSASFKQKWFEANNGFQHLKQSNRELVAINERYRVQITQLQGKAREADESAQQYQALQAQVKALGDTNAALEVKNRSLKSRIFDSMETEKQLKERIAALRAGGAGGAADDQVAQLLAQIGSLKDDLRKVKAEREAKAKENKELVSICDDLLNKLEIAKGKK